MSRIRVLDLAKEFNLDTKTTLAKLQEMGLQVKNHFNGVSDYDADKFRSLMRSGKKSLDPKDASQKSATRVVIRRRSAEEPASEKTPHVTEDVAIAPQPQMAEAPSPTLKPTPKEPLETPTPVAAPGAEAKSTPVAAVSSPQPLSPADTKPMAHVSPGEPISRPSAQASEMSAPSPSSVEAPKASVVKNPSTSPIEPVAVPPTTVQPAAAVASDSAPSTQGPKTVATPSPTKATESAVIIRRAPPAPSQNAQPSSQSHRPSYGYGHSQQGNSPNQRPQGGGYGQSPNHQGGPRSGFSGNPSGTGGAYHRPSQNQPYQGQNRGSGFGPGGQRPSQGQGYSGQNRPQYQGQGYSGQQQSPSGYQGRPPQGAGGQGQRMGGGYGGPRDGAQPLGGGGPRPYVSGVSAPGGPRAQGGMGGPRGGGFPGGPSASTLPDTPGKDTSRMSSREREKEREAQRRRIEQEDEMRRNARLKGRGGAAMDDEFLDDEVTEEGGEERPVLRTVIPNRRRVAPRRKEKIVEQANPTRASKKVIRFDDNITVSDLASQLSVKSSAVIKSLMKLGMMASVNQSLDIETATLISQEFGFEVQNVSVSIDDILNSKKTLAQDTSNAEKCLRPPVVTIMGHVDHGKTSLLDSIRAANVAEKETGGITQHIGAYQVNYNGKKITFLDTPGHEAFTAMRARGAQVTDVVVLVVAADDGAMPQTLEAIAHAQAAKVPIIVAVNKMDKATANMERVQRELSEKGVIPEEWGGDCIFVPVSAKTRQGIGDLLEAISLQAEVLELKAPFEGLAAGVVIESKLDKSRGPVATVIVTQGKLKISDWVVVGKTYGRVRALFNDLGEKLTEAEPSTPVEILGLNDVPSSGDVFNCVVSDAVAKEAVAFRLEKQRQKDLASHQKMSVQDYLAKLADDANKLQELPLIVKADTHGSVEAICAAIQKIASDKIKSKVIFSGVGGISESDVTLGHASKALILGFNVRPDKVASLAAEREGVEIKTFGIIYELIETVESAMVGRLAPVKSEKVIGHAEVRNLFQIPKVGLIAGTSVTDGKIIRGAHMRVLRNSAVVYTGKVGSLRRFKEDAKEVAHGFECGISVENYNDIKVGDVLEAFIIEESAATLT